MTNKVELVVISGRSGSGKTVALHALEDLGFYCIDNLPIVFLKELIDLAKKSFTGCSRPQYSLSSFSQ